jgi:hypothetical protein
MTLLSQFDALHEQATKATGLDDFGSTDYVAPMKLMLSTYDKVGTLNDFAKQMTAGMVTGILVGRLVAQQGLKAHPEFLNPKIEKPIIIVGMPRTGSTAKDPDVQWLPPWLSSTPMPRPPRELWETNPWYQMYAKGLEQFYQTFPCMLDVHPVRVAEPDECRFIFDHTFWSPAMAALGAFGEYSDWLTSCDAHSIYAYHRKVLGLIAGGDTRRWLLKDPTTHPFVMQTLVDTYPDACIVYTHRDPVTAMSSVSSMIYSMRKLREPGLTTEQNGRDQMALLGPAAAKTEAVLSKLPPDRVIDLHIKELEGDPVGSAEKIYRHFRLPVTDAARQAWTHHANTDARSGHGGHSHKLESAGLSASEVYASVGGYGDRYKRLYGDCRLEKSILNAEAVKHLQ